MSKRFDLAAYRGLYIAAWTLTIFGGIALVWAVVGAFGRLLAL